MAPCAGFFAEWLRDRASVVDLPVPLHQHLNRLHPAQVFIGRPAFMHIFVGEVIDSMSQQLKGMSGLGRDDVRRGILLTLCNFDVAIPKSDVCFGEVEIILSHFYENLD